MATGRSIRIAVSPIGDVKIDAEGYQGVSCEDATKVFVNAFSGGKVTDTKKPEYYESEGVGGKLTQTF